MSNISSISVLSDSSAAAAGVTVARQKTATPQPSVSSAASLPSASASASASPIASSSRQTIALLQEQMLLYTQYSNGTGPAASAYQALQYAIQTNNVSAAQTAMAKLQLDSASATASASATTNSNLPGDSVVNQNASSGQTQKLSGDSLNLTA